MRVVMQESVSAEISAHARGEYPRECCGILVGKDGAVVRVVRGENGAERGRLRDRYVIEPLLILRTEKAARAEGLEVVGFYHSHPDHAAVPSAVDVAAGWEGYVYVIVQSRAEGGGEMRAWKFLGNGGMEEVDVDGRR